MVIQREIRNIKAAPEDVDPALRTVYDAVRANPPAPRWASWLGVPYPDAEVDEEEEEEDDDTEDLGGDEMPLKGRLRSQHAEDAPAEETPRKTQVRSPRKRGPKRVRADDPSTSEPPPAKRPRNEAAADVSPPRNQGNTTVRLPPLPPPVPMHPMVQTLQDEGISEYWAAIIAKKLGDGHPRLLRHLDKFPEWAEIPELQQYALKALAGDQ